MLRMVLTKEPPPAAYIAFLCCPRTKHGCSGNNDITIMQYSTVSTGHFPQLNERLGQHV